MICNVATVAIAALAGLSAALPQASVTRSAATGMTTGSTPISNSTGSYGVGIPPAEEPLASPALASIAAVATEAAQQLTAVDRFNSLLTEGGMLLEGEDLDARVKFNFNRAPEQGEGGRFLLANKKNFPILVDQGISTAVGFLEPCSMNSPHTHPRATEWLTVVQGELESGMMIENNFVANAEIGQLTTEVATTLHAFEGTVFPQGAIHYQFNPSCDKPATFVATLNSDDPGASQVTQNYFFLNPAIVDITLGGVQVIDGSNIEQFRQTLPPNLVQSVDACRARCGMN